MKTLDILLAIAVLLSLCSFTHGDEAAKERTPVVGPEWKPAEESVVLATGLKAHSIYHFNRNALASACITDDGILAATDSGNLLRFDLSDLRLQQEIRPDAAITALIKADGFGVLAGCADGRVFRIDLKTLKLTEFAKLPAAPKWMTGFRDAEKQANGVLAAVVKERKEGDGGEIEFHRLGFQQPNSEKNKEPPPRIDNSRIGAFHVNRKSRLWLGQDAGEWGGWCANIDLKTGKLTPVEEPKDSSTSGVYGFVELPDGQVWAFGGTMHLGLAYGCISRVDRGKWEMLGTYGKEQQEKTDMPPKQPRYPITHIIPDPKGDGLLLFSYSDMFRVDTKLRNWRHFGYIELRYRWGRPDAVGSYPALRDVHAVGRNSGDLICPTARDGLLRIRDGQVTQYVVPRQIGDDRIGRILAARGTTFLSGANLWQYIGGAWQSISMFPSTQPNEYERWHEDWVMLDRDRILVALCRTNRTSGTATLTRWKDDKVEIIASDRGRHVDFAAYGAFTTPDGHYWCTDYENVLRLVDGKWKRAGKSPDRALWGLRVVGQGKRPWILHGENSLHRLTRGEGAQDATLTPIPLPAELGKVHDALAFKPGQLLLATTAGLRLFDEKTNKVSQSPIALPKGEVHALCHDGRGRIWLAGSSVWMVDAKGKVHDFDKLARYGVVANAIGADSTDATGVIVALRERGVLFLRAEHSNH